MRVDMDRKTARKDRDRATLPSDQEVWPRAWRTREDPFTAVWEEVQEKLELSPGLQANTLFAWLQQRYPGRFPNGQLRRGELAAGQKHHELAVRGNASQEAAVFRRGVFRSVAALEAAIIEYLANHNENPRPFVWTANADLILERVKKVWV